MRDLYVYQVPLLERACRFEQVPIYVEKRLGKTPISIRWALSKPGVRRILVVAPLSACPDWMTELESDGQFGVLLVGDRQLRLEKLLAWDREHAAGRTGGLPIFYVINPNGLYKSARTVKCTRCAGRGCLESEDGSCSGCEGKGRIRINAEPTEFATLPWDVVIYDESTSIRNPRATITAIVQEYLSRCRYKTILSGEPAPEGPQDFFCQMRFLYGHFMGHRNFWKWRDDNFRQVGYDHMLKPGRMQLIKEAVHARSVVMTRKDAGVGEQKTFERRYCELPPKMRKVYDDAIRTYELSGDIPGAETEAKYVLEIGNWLSQIAGGFVKDRPDLQSSHKIDVLEELLTGEYAKEQVVVTFRYNLELAAVAQRLSGLGVKVCFITGATPVEERRRIQESFRAGRYRVLLAQVKVFKFGIDCSAADTMIRYSLPYSYEEISQSMDRIVHPAKKRPLHYIDLVCTDTVDEDVIEAIGDKRIDARYFMNKLTSRLVDRLRSSGKKKEIVHVGARAN